MKPSLEESTHPAALGFSSGILGIMGRVSSTLHPEAGRGVIFYITVEQNVGISETTCFKQDHSDVNSRP